MADDRVKGEQKGAGRAMPFSDEAERSVLSSVLIDAAVAQEIIPTMTEEDFFSARNRLVFRAIKELYDAMAPIDLTSVSDRLEVGGHLDDVGGADYIIELASFVPSAANGEYYADIVKRDALTRKVISSANDIAKYAYSSETGIDALNYAEQTVFAIAEGREDKSLLKATTAVQAALNGIQDAQKGLVPSGTVYTGFEDLDRMTRGLKPGELVLIAARPSVGKTAFALNIAANVCLDSHKTVAIFSLEMPAPLLVKRMLAYVGQVSLSRMDKHMGLNDSEEGRLIRAYDRLYDAELYIDDYSMNTPADLMSKCRRLKREHGLDLIIVDYLQLMTTGKAYESNRVQAVSSMSRNMKLYAGALGVPIVLLSQMSRDIDKRDDHTPQLSDLRESGAIEQDADVVMFLHNPSKYAKGFPEDIVQLLLRKNRNGPIGDIHLKWTGETTTFKAITKEEYDAAREQAKRAAEEYVHGESEKPSAEVPAPEAAAASAPEAAASVPEAAGAPREEGRNELRKLSPEDDPFVSAGEKPAEENAFEEEATEAGSVFETENGSESDLPPFDTDDESPEGGLPAFDAFDGEITEDLPFDAPAPTDDDAPAFGADEEYEDDEYVDDGDGDDIFDAEE